MLRDELGRLAGDVVHATWERVVHYGALGPRHRHARSFRKFGEGSLIAFPPSVIYGEGRISLGCRTTIGPLASISAGMPTQAGLTGEPVITIGDRCMLGKGIGIIGHERIDIGDDIWTGHYVYITDQNHGYEDVDLPIGVQMWTNEPVSIGSGSWLGHGAVVLPGAHIGEHVVVAGGAVVTAGKIPDHSVVAGVPARVVRRYEPGAGWRPVTDGPAGT